MSNNRYRQGNNRGRRPPRSSYQKQNNSQPTKGLPDQNQVLEILFKSHPQAVTCHQIRVPGFQKKQINNVLYSLMRSNMVQRSDSNPPQWRLLERGRSIYVSNLDNNASRSSTPVSTETSYNRNPVIRQQNRGDFPTTSTQQPPEPYYPPPHIPPSRGKTTSTQQPPEPYYPPPHIPPSRGKTSSTQQPPEPYYPPPHIPPSRDEYRFQVLHILRAANPNYIPGNQLIEGFHPRLIHRCLYEMVTEGLIIQTNSNPPDFKILPRGIYMINNNLVKNQASSPPHEHPPRATLGSTNPNKTPIQSPQSSTPSGNHDNAMLNRGSTLPNNATPSNASPTKGHMESKLNYSLLDVIHKTQKIKEYDLVAKFTKNYSKEKIKNTIVEMEKNGLIMKSNIHSSPAWIISSRGTDKINQSKKLALLKEGDTNSIIPLIEQIKLDRDEVESVNRGQLPQSPCLYSPHGCMYDPRNDNIKLAINFGQRTNNFQNVRFQNTSNVTDQNFNAMDFSDDMLPTQFFSPMQEDNTNRKVHILQRSDVARHTNEPIEIAIKQEQLENTSNDVANVEPRNFDATRTQPEIFDEVDRMLNEVIGTVISLKNNTTQYPVASASQEEMKSEVKMEESLLANSTKNSVSQLNEYAQQNKLSIDFQFEEEGPPHNKNFTATVTIGNQLYPPMCGSSKKEAKINVAHNTMIILSGTGALGEKLVNKSQVAKQEPPPPTDDPPISNTYTGSKNAVSVINEYAQANHLNIEFDCAESGSDHSRRFHTTLILDGKSFPAVIGTNKKDSKLKAAENAVTLLKIVPSFIPGSSTYAQENSPHMQIKSYHDRVANMVNQKFDELLSNLPDTIVGRKILAGFVMSQTEVTECGEETRWEVVSIGSGNRCVAGDKLTMEGDTVNDCHAEIIARRGLMRFFYQQINLLISDPEKSIFEIIEGSERYHLRSGITFHLYISTAPCGDGALFAHSDTRGREGDADENVHTPIFDNKKQGILRTKVENGEGCIPIEDDANVPTWDGVLRGERLRTMSCSDKIARWNFVGLQGALLSQIIKPVYMSSLTLGMLYNHGHLTRAICCRVARNLEEAKDQIEIPENYRVHHPQVAKITGDDPARDTGKVKTREFSINWCIGDEKAEVMDGTTGHCEARFGSTFPVPRVSKRVLFQHFRELNPSKEYKSYVDAKKLATNHQMGILAMKTAFEICGGGKWMTKPPEVDDFS